MEKNHFGAPLGAIDKAERGYVTPIGKVLYTAKTHTTGGRENGLIRSSDLLAAGWSVCFEGAMGILARKMKITLPEDLAIDAEVDLCLSAAGAYFLKARLNIYLPGLDRDAAQVLIEAAHQTCPYSKAIRGSFDVAINLI
jgi:osmotically inducible protein OsmC